MPPVTGAGERRRERPPAELSRCETLRPLPADYVPTEAEPKPAWRRTVVAALAAACLPALAYGAFLYFLLTRSPS